MHKKNHTTWLSGIYSRIQYRIIWKSINKIHHINRLKKKNLWSIDEEKAFEKLHTHSWFLKNTLSKLRIEGNFLYLIKNKYENEPILLCLYLSIYLFIANVSGIVFLMSNSNCSLLVYEKPMTFVSYKVAMVFISSKTLLLILLDFLHRQSCHLQAKFYFFLLNMYTFYFLCLSLAQTHSTMLKKVGEGTAFALGFILVAKHPVSHHEVWC